MPWVPVEWRETDDHDVQVDTMLTELSESAKKAAATLEDMSERMSKLIDRIAALESEKKERDEQPKSPPTHIGTPMTTSASFRSVGYSRRMLGEGEPPYIA